MGVYYIGNIPFDNKNDIQHFGKKGMKWGKHIMAAPEVLVGAGNKAGTFTRGAITKIGNAVNKGVQKITGKSPKKANSSFGAYNEAINAQNKVYGQLGNLIDASDKVDNAWDVVTASTLVNDPDSEEHKAARKKRDEAIANAEKAESALLAGANEYNKKVNEYGKTPMGRIANAATTAVGKLVMGRILSGVASTMTLPKIESTPSWTFQQSNKTDDFIDNSLQDKKPDMNAPVRPIKRTLEGQIHSTIYPKIDPSTGRPKESSPATRPKTVSSRPSQTYQNGRLTSRPKNVTNNGTGVNKRRR